MLLLTYYKEPAMIATEVDSLHEEEQMRVPVTGGADYIGAVNIEEARTAFLALPGVCRVCVSTHTLEPVTQVSFDVYCGGPDISQEETGQAIENIQEIKDSLQRDMGCTVFVGIIVRNVIS